MLQDVGVGKRGFTGGTEVLQGQALVDWDGNRPHRPVAPRW